MYGRGETTDGHEPAVSGTPARHREQRTMSAPVALALTVTGLLSAFGAGAALLPQSVTGTGSAAETPAAAVAALAPEPGALGAGTPGGGALGAGTPGAGGAADPLGGTDPAASVAPGPAPSASSRSTNRTPAPSATPKADATDRATTKPAAPKSTKATPKKATPKKAAPKAGPDQVSQENEVIRLANVERDRAGCGPVRLDTRLRTAMRLHVEELGTHGGLYISHVSDDGRTFVQRAQAQGYREPGGENVARGQRTAADVMSGWMNSEGHRANILNCSFKAIGVGRAKGVDGTLVWGQLFGRS